MRSTRRLGISLTLTVGAVAAALFVATAHGAGTPPRFTFIDKTDSREYLTAAGSTSVFPGRLLPGDRVLSHDSLLQGSRSAGYFDEVCTVTLGNYDLCEAMITFPGKGQIQASWMSRWPVSFTGVIDGGTGAFADASGEFAATVLRSGSLRITATLR
jgi:hypothetical protein